MRNGDLKHVVEERWRRKKGRRIQVPGRTPPINGHLLKLLAVEGDRDRQHWTKEMLEQLDEVAEIRRLKPDSKPGPASFYYRILFDEPFGGTGVANIARRIGRLERQGHRPRDADPDNVPQRLQQFHGRFSDACHRGAEAEDISDLIVQTVAQAPRASEGRYRLASGRAIPRHPDPRRASHPGRSPRRPEGPDPRSTGPSPASASQAAPMKPAAAPVRRPEQAGPARGPSPTA